MEVGNKTKEKNKKTGDEIKKDLNGSIVNCKKQENKETEETAKMIEKPKDAPVWGNH